MKTFEENFLFPNLTSAEYWEAQAYYFNLHDMSPKTWRLPKEIVIDIPVKYRYLYMHWYTYRVNSELHSVITNQY